MRKAHLVAALLLSTLAFDVKAQVQISDYDIDRLERLAEAKATALDELQDAAMNDRAAVEDVLRPEGRAITARDLDGNWRCRIMKVGGLEPAKVYPWFNCRISQKADGLYFEKRNGSERLSGYIEEGPNGLVLLGAISVRNETPNLYSGGRQGGAGARSSTNDQVGLISSIGQGRARIEFPYPLIESTFDVIELRR
jgi:hypothetical protein